MDCLLISIMSVKGDIEGSLEFGVSEGYHTRLLQFMFITMNNGQVIVNSSETWNLRVVKIQVNLDLLFTLMLKKS